ncbi:GDSL-type esterase/lipase family protein [Nocardioides aurantiacus]|uniref:GDSL-like lipase/acylhydrolase family protein n=1 Tax=Nocardioides aurantiacus TaxID=86796 RepID=A0A3N2CRX3_9ACTN|nr:GDSL-type esterase/lipase family protein [Nocardioides aurantiacus]ROR90292.1 GDSL-like lipase/acylhydrolase family protein [Nocardioides aurantiacus]
MTTPLHDVPLVPDLVRGALDLERTEHGLLPHRLPAGARARIPDEQLAMAETQPSGVRLALRTAATVLELDVLPTKRVYVGAPPRPDGVHELVLDGRVVATASATGGRTLRIDMGTGRFERLEGPVAMLRFDRLPAGEKDLVLWLPHDETTELVALRADAPVTPAPTHGRPTWLHHGSSVSHGSNAVTPTGTWPALAAAAAGVELVNLGFGGGALLDPFVARTVRDAPADLLSLKLGINVVNADLVRRRAFAPAVHGFLDTVRDGHPDTPLLLVSPILCPLHEQTPGPLVPDAAAFAEGRVAFRASGDPSDPTRLTLERVREDLARVVAERTGEDPHLAYLDGRELYGEADAGELPLPDGLHPDDATHALIGERFARLALGPGGVLARAREPR